MSINRLHHHEQTSTTNYLQLQNDLVESWQCSLTLAEAAVCRFIARRTLTFKKDWETIPERHFLEGVRDYVRGGFVSHPCPVSRPTLLRCLKVLTTPDSQGGVAVFRRLVTYQSRFTGQTLQAYEYCLNRDYMPLKTARPKKEISARYQPDTLPPYHYDTQGGITEIRPNDTRKECIGEEYNICADSADQPVSKPLLKAPKRVPLRLPLIHGRPAARPVKEDSAPNNSPCHDGTIFDAPPPREKKVSHLEQAKRLWLTLEKEFVTSNKEGRQLSPVLPWGAAQHGMMKTLIGKWIEGGGDFEDFLEIIRDSLTNWIAVTNAMNIHSAPQPALGLFVKCFTGFRDRKQNLALLQDKADQYREVVKVQRDSRLFDKFTETGKIDKRDEKKIAKEVRIQQRQSVLPTNKREALAEQNAAIARLGPVAPTRYDEEGMPIHDLDFVIPEFDHNC